MIEIYSECATENKFLPEPEPDCYNLGGTETESTSYKYKVSRILNEI